MLFWRDEKPCQLIQVEKPRFGTPLSKSDAAELQSIQTELLFAAICLEREGERDTEVEREKERERERERGKRGRERASERKTESSACGA